jgi:hypothetical protein
MRHIRLYENFEAGTEREAFPSGGKAYHITPDIYIDSIMQTGLTPRTESKISPHPGRIYLLLNPEDTFKGLARSLWRSSPYREKVKNYHVLEVDLTQLPEHRFFIDEESLLTYVGIYTTQSIPASALTVIETIPVKALDI